MYCSTACCLFTFVTYDNCFLPLPANPLLLLPLSPLILTSYAVLLRPSRVAVVASPNEKDIETSLRLRDHRQLCYANEMLLIVISHSA